MAASPGTADADTHPDPTPPAACASCGASPRYRCPRCGARSCCAACVAAHKQATGCTGKRDRAAFLPLAAMTEATLVSDVRLLEEAAAAAADARDAAAPLSRGPPPGRSAACLPPHLKSLASAAAAGGVRLSTLPAGMTRRRRNTSCVEQGKEGEGGARPRPRVRWRLEWRLAGDPAGEPAFVDARADPDATLGALLTAHLAKAGGGAADAAADAAAPSSVTPYAAVPATDLTILLQLEGRPANAPAFARLDAAATVSAALAGRAVVEYPVLTVALPQEEDAFGRE